MTTDANERFKELKRKQERRSRQMQEQLARRRKERKAAARNEKAASRMVGADRDKRCPAIKQPPTPAKN